MTIEKSPATVTAHKATARADGQGPKSKAPDAGADAGGGFMAILGALGDAASETAAPVVPALDSMQPDTSAALPNAFDAATLLQQNPQIAAAQAQIAAASSASASAAAQALSAAALQLAAAVPADASLDAPSGQAALPVQLPLQAAEAQAKLALPGAAQAKVLPAQAATPFAMPTEPQQGVESLTQGLQQAGVHGKPGKDGFKGLADTSSSTSGVVSTSGERADSAKLAAALEQVKAPQLAKALESVFVPLMVKPDKPLSERTAFSFKNAEPGYAGTTLGVSAPDYSQPAVAVPAMAPEMQVAEQVTYWVSQNVQNAELKLDGLGQSPVEVSISVQGKEAQITFRTDEAVTRGVLESAGAHLKDMLQREGLVLTGVSIGTSSGNGDSGNGERRARPGVRQGLIVPTQVASAVTLDNGRRMNTVAGRSVDLFV